jgi:hypothetical protein
MHAHHTLSRLAYWGLAVALGATVTACSKDNGAPTGPSGSGDGSTTAAADGTTLKATAPTINSPKDRVVTDSLRPTLQVNVARGRFADSGLAHRFELRDEDNNAIAGYLVAAGGGNTAELTIPDSIEMQYNKVYRWRCRGELNNTFGPWSSTAEFVTPAPPRPGSGGSVGGPVGPTRRISPVEALSIMIDVHNRLRYDLGSNSTREQRVAWLWASVAAIHYGHPVFNPAGADPDWCVKDAGGGRPPSDDVLVSCSTREAYDTVGGAGSNGYTFHLDYLGRLGGEQNVYPPPISSLP